MTGRKAVVEGMSSLAQAFLVAGVPAVLGTLWDIDDEDAVPIMTVVHDRMAHGVPLSEAVRAAQIKAIRSSSAYARSPNRWAGFAVMGVNATPSPAPR
jgi:CHAT domain-containing protein